MHKRDYKIGSFKFIKEGGSFNYAEVSDKKGEIINIFLNPRDDTWYFIYKENTKFNVINLNRFVECPYYQYRMNEVAKEALAEFST